MRFTRETETHLFEIMAIASNVLVVASVNIKVGDWAVYLGGVKGHDYEIEWHSVKAYGDKIRKEIGEILFPQYKKYTWRD